MASVWDCRMVVRTVLGVVGVVVGVIVACVFGAVYHNVHAASWGLVSGVVAALTLHVHIIYVKGWYEADPGPFRLWLYCGCVCQLAGITAFIVYIVLAVTENQGLVIYGPGYYLASVWCAMTWKWGFQLFYFSRSYWRRLVGPTLFLSLAKDATPAEKDYGSTS